MTDVKPTVKDFNAEENENTKEAPTLAKSSSVDKKPKAKSQKNAKGKKKGKKDKDIKRPVYDEAAVAGGDVGEEDREFENKLEKYRKARGITKEEDEAEQQAKAGDMDTSEEQIDEQPESDEKPTVHERMVEKSYADVAKEMAEETEKLDGTRIAKERPMSVSGVDRVPLKDGQFTNFEPLTLTTEMADKITETVNQMRNGKMAEVGTKTLGDTWQAIIAHVRQGKPVFFNGVPAGMPDAFFAKNPGAVQSAIHYGDGVLDLEQLPRGQFHFGTITAPRPAHQLIDAGFLMVGCSGSAKYYSQNVKGRDEPFREAMTVHRKLTQLRTQKIIIGFIHKPSPALDVLVKQTDGNSKPESVPEILPE
jgi:hypothetical protein